MENLRTELSSRAPPVPATSPPPPSAPTNDDIEAVIQMATSARSSPDGRSGPPRDTRTQLFVGNLPYRVRWQDLKDLFRKAGTVLRADVSLGPDNRSRGYGTVLLATAEDAGRAIDIFNGYSWQTRILEVRADRLPPDFESPMSGNLPQSSSSHIPQSTSGSSMAGLSPFASGSSGVLSAGGFSALSNEIDYNMLFGLERPGSSLGSGRNLFVGNLPFHCQWQDLKDLFRQAGTIVRADVALGQDGRSRGFGTVSFATDYDAERAVQMFNGYEYNGRTLKVHYDKFTQAGQGSTPASPTLTSFQPSQSNLSNLSAASNLSTLNHSSYLGGSSPFASPFMLNQSQASSPHPGQIVMPAGYTLDYGPASVPPSPMSVYPPQLQMSVPHPQHMQSHVVQSPSLSQSTSQSPLQSALQSIAQHQRTQRSSSSSSLTRPTLPLAPSSLRDIETLTSSLSSMYLPPKPPSPSRTSSSESKPSLSTHSSSSSSLPSSNTTNTTPLSSSDKSSPPPLHATTSATQAQAAQSATTPPSHHQSHPHHPGTIAIPPPPPSFGIPMPMHNMSPGYGMQISPLYHPAHMPNMSPLHHPAHGQMHGQVPMTPHGLPPITPSMPPFIFSSVHLPQPSPTTGSFPSSVSGSSALSSNGGMGGQNPAVGYRVATQLHQQAMNQLHQQNLQNQHDQQQQQLAHAHAQAQAQSSSNQSGQTQQTPTHHAPPHPRSMSHSQQTAPHSHQSHPQHSHQHQQPPTHLFSPGLAMSPGAFWGHPGVAGAGPNPYINPAVGAPVHVVPVPVPGSPGAFYWGASPHPSPGWMGSGMGTGQGTAGTEPGGYFDTYFPPAAPASASTYAGVEGEILKDKGEKREERGLESEQEGRGERRGRDGGSVADLRGWEGRSGGLDSDEKRDENEDAVDDKEEEEHEAHIRKGSNPNAPELFRNRTEGDGKTKNEFSLVNSLEGNTDGTHAMGSRTLSMNSYLGRPTKPSAVNRSDSDPATTVKEAEKSDETVGQATSPAGTDGVAEKGEKP